MTTRYDTSAVPLQGAYVAKRCPVRAQNDAILPGVPVQPDAFVQRLFDRGNAFEDEVLSELDADGAAVLIEGRGLEAETATLEAMRRAARLILNGRLADEAGRRVGKPDLLVHAPSGYRAIDIKFHRALDVADRSRESDPALVSDLSSPSFEAAREDLDFNARRNEGDLLQLAHYQRMLESMGMAVPRTADSQGSSAPSSWWSGTTSTRDLADTVRRRRRRSCAAPWSAMTSSSTFGSTSSPWRGSINSTPLSSFSSSRFDAQSARTARGANTAARSSKLRPGT